MLTRIFWDALSLPSHFKNLANVAQKRITHRPGVHHKFELNCVNTFSDNGRKPALTHFQSLFGHQRAKIRATWPKSKPIPDTHPTSVHYQFELVCVNRIWDNGRKPTFLPIFSNFLATRGPQLGQRSPKVNQFWTLTQTSNLRLIKWLLFQIMVGNPGRTDTDARSPFLCSLPTSSAGTINSSESLTWYFLLSTSLQPGAAHILGFNNSICQIALGSETFSEMSLEKDQISFRL